MLGGVQVNVGGVQNMLGGCTNEVGGVRTPPHPPRKSASDCKSYHQLKRMGHRVLGR